MVITANIIGLAKAASYTGEEDGIRSAKSGMRDYIIYKNLSGKDDPHEQPYLKYPESVLANMEDSDRKELAARLAGINEAFSKGDSSNYIVPVLANDIAYSRDIVPSRFGGTLGGLIGGVAGGAASGAGLAHLLGAGDGGKVAGGLLGAAGLGTLLTILGRKRDKAKRNEDMQQFVDKSKKKLSLSDSDVREALALALKDSTHPGPLSGNRLEAIKAVMGKSASATAPQAKTPPAKPSAPVIMPPKPKEQQSGKPGLPIYGKKRLALEAINNELEAREKDPRRYGLVGDMFGLNKREELPKPKPLFGW